MSWSNRLPVEQVRLTRPTHDLAKIERFYCGALGLPKLQEFQSQAGYLGMVVGLPGWAYHLEFTQHPEATPLPGSDSQQQLVLYLADKEAIGRLVVRLGGMGFFPSQPSNPYWADKGVSIPDPDGWHVVLVESP